MSTKSTSPQLEKSPRLETDRVPREQEVRLQTEDRLERLALANEVEEQTVKPAVYFDEIPDIDPLEVEVASQAIDEAYGVIESQIQRTLQDQINRINEKIRATASQEARTPLINERYDKQSGLDNVKALLTRKFPKEWLMALVAKESRFKADARSHTNAKGLFQITSSAVAGVEKYFSYSAENLDDPVKNATVGILYLARCRFHFADKIAPALEESEKDLLALSLYNGGYGTVKELWTQLNPVSYTDFELKLSGALCDQLGRDDCSSTLVDDPIYGVRYREYGGISACLDPRNAGRMEETLRIGGKEVTNGNGPLSVRKAGEVLRYTRMIHALKKLKVTPVTGPPLPPDRTSVIPESKTAGTGDRVPEVAVPWLEATSNTEVFKVPAGWGFFRLEKEFGVSRYYLGKLNGFPAEATELKAGQEIRVPANETYARAEPYFYRGNGEKPWITVQKGKGFWSILVKNEAYNKYLEEVVEISKEDLQGAILAFNRRFNPELANVADDAGNVIENAQIWIPNVDFFIHFYEGRFAQEPSTPPPVGAQAPPPAPEPPTPAAPEASLEIQGLPEALDRKTPGQYVRWDGRKWVRDKAEMARGAERFPRKQWDDHPTWVDMPKEKTVFSGSVAFDSVRYIVLHSTISSSSEETIRNRKAHFVIERDGTIKYIVYIEGVEKKFRMAPHAGFSIWNGQRNLNQHSIGIEVVAREKQDWSEAQKTSARSLVEWLGGYYGLRKRDVLRHRQVAEHESSWGRGRKSDPYDDELFEDLGLPDNDRLLDLDAAAGRHHGNGRQIKREGNPVWDGLKAGEAVHQSS